MVLPIPLVDPAPNESPTAAAVVLNYAPPAAPAFLLLTACEFAYAVDIRFWMARELLNLAIKVSRSFFYWVFEYGFVKVEFLLPPAFYKTPAIVLLLK